MKWMVLCIFGGLGLAALIAGLFWGVKRYELFKSGMRAQGKVVEHYKSVYRSADDERQGTSGSESYYPVVEYRTAAGETIRFRGSTGGGVPDFEVGTPVELIYNPQNPHEAQLVNFSQFWLGPVVAIAAGLIFLLMGVGTFFLIGGSDRSMAQAQKTMQRQLLATRSDAVKISGTITGLKEREPGTYVFICQALRPGAVMQDAFESDFFNFDPGMEFVGRPVTVYLDPFDRTNYYVEFGLLLKEIVAKQSR